MSPLSRRLQIACVVFFAAAGFVSSSAFAAARVWSGAGDGVNWSDGNNWVGNVAPVSGDVLTFNVSNTTTNANLGGAVLLDEIILNGSGNTITGAIHFDASNTNIQIEDDNDGNAITATITFSISDAFFRILNPNHKLTMSGTLSGATAGLGVRFIGAATSLFDLKMASNNTYTGTTEIDSGIVLLDSTSAGAVVPANLKIGGTGSTGTFPILRLGFRDCIADTSTVTVASNGTFDLNGLSETVASILATGPVTLGGSPLLTTTGITLSGGNVTGSGTVRIANGGTIGGSAGSIASNIAAAGPALTVNVTSGAITTGFLTEVAVGTAVTKSGSGTWEITGTNTQTGTTNVTAGVMQLDGTQTQSAILLSGGFLIGTGTAGIITGNSGALEPAGSATGNFTTGSMVLSSNASYVVDLANGEFDSLTVDGTINLNSAPLVLNNLSNFVRKTSRIVIINNDGSDQIIGTFSGISEGGTVSAGGETFRVTYKGGDGNDVELIAPNSAPTVSSAAMASPSPAGVTHPVTFEAGGADANNDPLTYSWSFGDGTTGSGSTTAHAYTAPGVYSISVTISDGQGGSVVSGTSLTVNPLTAKVGQGIDSDGDGFSDAFEHAAGTSSTNAASTPTGKDASGVKPSALAVKKAAIKLNFAKKKNDAISFTGTMRIPAGFVATGQKVTLDVGGVDQGFTLTKKGTGKAGKNSIKFSLIKDKKGKVKAQTSTYTVSLNKGSFASSLTDEGLVGTATVKNKKKSVKFTMVFNGKIFEKSAHLSYSAVKHRSGLATGN